MTEREEDAGLAVQAQAGNDEAIVSLYFKYLVLGRYWSMRLLHRWDEAVEIGDAGAAKMVDQIQNWRPTGSFRSWMYRMVKNLVMDHVRQRRFAPVDTSLDELAEVVPAAGGPEDADMACRVREAVAGLAPLQRQVVEACTMAGESLAGFARRTHSSVRVTAYRLKQAKLALRRRLSWFRVKIPCRISPAQALSY
jgi:RNA polymerase sigma-70 factor (ECF subfamily)